ncbi:hypothetical protein AB1Y20_018904 [Prymnesium parvum]|uniref:Uncharacterized protein n=1 Tax=Prymnesium parvum TaxID=97485 RepID=A0AB34JTT9_PRYPA
MAPLMVGGLLQLMERVESLPLTAMVCSTSEEPAPATSPSKKKLPSARAGYTEPALSSSLRAPKNRKTPSMVDPQPQRYDPLNHRGMKCPLSPNVGPGCYRQSTKLHEMSIREPCRPSAAFRSGIPRNIPFGSSSPYVWRPPRNMYGSPYSVTSKLPADLLSVQRRRVPGANPMQSIAQRFGDSPGDGHLQHLLLMRFDEELEPSSSHVGSVAQGRTPIWDRPLKSG